jgi:hypothetical protein
MSGQTGLGPASDEAARLEHALTRIARAASRRRLHTAPEAGAPEAAAALHGAAAQATRRGDGPDTAELAARLDGLIAELRTLLGAQDI